jgi:NAD(P)H-dependent FMN reductase
MKKLSVILASTRQSRSGQMVADWVMRELSGSSEFTVELVDLANYPLPWLESGISPIESKSPEALLAAWSAVIGNSDAFIFISPEYNHGYSGVLKNAIDSLKEEWFWKPAGIVGYGGISGGIRSIEQLRLVQIELKMRPTYASVILPFVWEAFNENGAPKHTGATDSLHSMVTELQSLLR